jgi:hypothetical protein
MGLYGILVVTDAVNGFAYPGVSYKADIPLLFSEIDPGQNRAVDKAVNTTGFSESAVFGPYSGQSVATFKILSGGALYTSVPTVMLSGGNGLSDPQAKATAVIDTDSTSPTYQQVTEVDVDPINPGANYTSPPTVMITGGGGTGATAEAALTRGPSSTCSGGASACYPAAVNYTPLYYLINGQAFDKNNPTASLFPSAPAANVSGSVLVRMVNAGLRMHVPSIVGAQTGGSGVSGFSLIAEDGNVLPGVPRVQSEVFLAAGKAYDVMINAPAACNPGPCTALPVFDRQLSLSGAAFSRDTGMLAYISVNGAALPADNAIGANKAIANPDTYSSVVAGQTLTISDASKGVLANDVNIYGVKVSGAGPTQGTLTLNANGTFTYVANAGWSGSDSFTYCGNGASSGPACATVTLNPANVELASGITCTAPSYTASNSLHIAINTPGVLAGCKDGAGYPLTVVTSSITPDPGLTVLADANGGFSATSPGASTYHFTFLVQNSQGTKIGGAVQATIIFPGGSGLQVTVLDGADKKTQISDYRWIIEEDRTFYVDPNCTTNPLPLGCPTINGPGSPPPVFGVNFHTSHMPVVATGCTGPLSCESGQTLGGVPVVCDVGNVCRTDATQQTAVDPKTVVLDPTKRYYISVLPGDAANPFEGGPVGHGMGGAPIAAGQQQVTVFTQPSPYPPATLTVFVFEDDYPLNGEHDAGGGVDILAPQEPGLGGFQITLFDDAGGTGDATGTPTYDMFNMPLTNSLAGQIDPVTGKDACPLATTVTDNAINGDGSQKGIVGMIFTCPRYESDGKTLSPLAGQAVVKNLYQGRYGVMATPAADRIARGEEWLQTNTLDGQKSHDSFMRIGEPAYFQEFGPAGFHVSIGFANPKIINSRKPNLCAAPGANCNNEVKGFVSTARMSRVPDERLYGSGSRDSFSFTQCYASLGDPEAGDFAFVKCDDQGNFDFTGIPAGNWKLTIFDQWNDQIVDGITTPVALAGQQNAVLNLGEVATHQWQANIYTRTFLDLNSDGVSNVDSQGNPTEPGLPLVATNIRFRDGSFSNFNNTDLNGFAGFNEVFPLFNWYVVETDTTRYKSTGTHVVYDSGGPTDGTCNQNTAPCGASGIGQNMANTYEANPLPANLSVPGAVYCPEGADCSQSSIANGPVQSGAKNTGRIDPPFWFGSYGWQGFSGQNSFLEFGKKPFAEHETGGIHGHVVYASTRPFDDPQLLLQTSWEPLVPHVRVNLYKEDIAADKVTPTLTLIDHTDTSSFDDWAQGFRSDGKPNMSCPGQSNTDLYFYGLQNQPFYLDWYNSQHGGPTATLLPYQAQYKCYDGMHNWNQLQPAPYDGMYSFPSVTSLDPSSGKPTGTNCTACVPNPSSPNPNDPNYDPYRAGTPMLPPGKYVVEVVVPPGYELVKEEDKNILIGDNYIAPATQQFAGLANVFILPDQAELSNVNSGLNSTQSLGRNSSLPSHEGDTGSVETFWPCVGESRMVPDYLSLFPQAQEVAPFAGATRNLCDRKEITLTDQTAALAKFYIFTSTHAAAHFTGIITDDFTAEFDPFSPYFGEKFSPAYLPVSVKDWTGTEVARVYSDEFGAYNGLNYSTWEVNPPNPTGYGPTMMVTCMNDAGTGINPDALYQPGYSQFCYELPFMPAQTGYFDTPVIPTSSFSEGYNHPDCAYPDATPAIKEVDGDGVGPWVSAPAKTLTITALGDQQVGNYGYSGPSTSTPPFNQKSIQRHYGFGACTLSNGVCTNGASVTIGGKPAPVTSWNDSQIKVTAPSGVPPCAVQQQTQYGGSNAQCGQLVITNANGRQSVDTVTVTIGGKAPKHVPGDYATIQIAMDKSAPGDLVILDPGLYNEMVIMWKPVRLQGVGAVSSIINADPHPAGKLDPWRKQVGCLFGLTPDGQPNLGDTSCESGWNFASGGPNFPTMIADRVPLEGILGWDTTVNGNLAEQLIEPSLMGSFEGAGITVLGKGVNIPQGAVDAWGSGAEAAFPTGSVLLSASACANNGTNPYPSNYYCNPSSIDGLSIKNSSQGGGGIYVHAWAHNLQIANNRVHNNQGSMAGGITVGQGEHIEVYLAGADPATVIPPGSCESALIPNKGLPFCYDVNVNVHHNAVTLNSSLGDELFSSTPAGAGGVVFCNGADYYQFKYNWVCGNMNTGDGGGFSHVGYIKNGDIEHNTIAFNQSTNPSIPTSGGGIIIMGAPDPDPPCSTNDQDCVPDPASIPPSDGTGPGLVINANLIIGNAADSGSGGGLRLQHVNGTDVINFPRGNISCLTLSTCLWNTVSVTNNIIVNNVAGWDGGGVSLQDALAVNIVNNTIMSNDSTAASGVLFNSLFAPLASSPGNNCSTQIDPNNAQSCPQPAGLASVGNSSVLLANLPSTFTCPLGHGDSGNTCAKYSVPLMANNVFWENRSFFIGVTQPVPPNQQSTIALFNWDHTAAVSQPQANNISNNGNGKIITGGTGACPRASYWDIGVRGDTGPSDHTAGRLNPIFSVLTDAGDYPGQNNLGADPTVLQQYCNGSRVPPELGSMGYTVIPGTNEANALPTPVFSLTPSATVDEGNNWVNVRWGPLSLSQPVPVNGVQLGNYGLAVASPAINQVGPLNIVAYALAPPDDFYGNARKTVADPKVDLGAVEAPPPAAPILSSVAPNQGFAGTNVPVVLTGTHLTGVTLVSVSGLLVTVPSFTVVNDTTINATFNINILAARTTRNVTVTGPGGPSNSVGFTVLDPPPALAVAPTTLPFGNQFVNVVSTGQTLTLTNSGGGTANNLNVAVTGPFLRNGGTCGTSLAGSSNCTIVIQFKPSALGAANGQVTITASNGTVTGSPVSLTGTGIADPAKPALSVLDNFNRANANTLGANWNQLVVLGVAGLQVNTNQAVCGSCGLGPANGYWNTSFNAKQGAQFTVVNATLNGDSVLMAATGSFTLGAYANFVRVNYNGGNITVATTTTGGLTYSTAATLPAALANGDIVTVLKDASGTVFVWTRHLGVDTFVGGASLGATWAGAGRIGMQLPNGARVDDFAGGNVP